MLFALLLCALSDWEPTYRALHDDAPTEALRTENVELRRDKGSVTLLRGQLAFIKTPSDRPVIGVFTGEGVFRLKPTSPIEANYLAKVTGKAEIEEAFDSAVFSSQMEPMPK
jgi:hypothetical protein